MLCDGGDGSDSAGTGGASIPNYLGHPTSDLWIEGSFRFLQADTRGLICMYQYRYRMLEEENKLTLLVFV